MDDLTRKILITNDIADMFQAIIEDRERLKAEKVIDRHTRFLFFDENDMTFVVIHWEHRFNNMISRCNDIYRVQRSNITPHVFRHTYCSNQTKVGMYTKTLQDIMGLSNISVTMNVNTHIGFDDIEGALKRMEEFKKVQVEVEKNEKPMSKTIFMAI